MRERIAQLATPRKLVATECCVMAFVAATAVLALGPTPLVAALLSLCALSMVPAFVTAGRPERRGSND